MRLKKTLGKWSIRLNKLNMILGKWQGMHGRKWKTYSISHEKPFHKSIFHKNKR
jgi:hypothetical protein